jgi:threonylcarbamoyladenosine tRNA methylthiotransferase MtaB
MDRIGDRELKRFVIRTLGCKVNQCDSAYMANMLSSHGFSPTSDGRASACIINTCTVTQRADYQSRQFIRRTVRENPNALIIVAGCYPQVAAEEVTPIHGVDYIIGNKDKEHIADIVKNGSKQNSPKIYLTPFGGPDNIFNPGLDTFANRTRGFVKIQEGCNSFCTYCIVPYARGRSRSLPPDRVFGQAGSLVENGHKELVLTGIHLGHYGRDLAPKIDLLYLLKALEGIRASRIRLSSIDPSDLSYALICYIAESKVICPHIHIPLQSGDNRILRRMNRAYTASFFRELVLDVAKRIPDVCIGVDVMAGFPGEGDREFLNTYNLIDTLPIGYLHVFPYSRRKGTKAYDLPNQVSASTITLRTRELRELGRKKRLAFYRNHLGKRVQVLIEGKMDGNTGMRQGFTENYIPVIIDWSDQLRNRLVEVELESIIENSTPMPKIRAIRR